MNGDVESENTCKTGSSPFALLLHVLGVVDSTYIISINHANVDH